jgi:hypothetical protein
MAFTALGVVVGPASATATTTWCGGAQLPSDFAITDQGRPYYLHAPYADKTLYNPTNIANFVNVVLDDSRNSTADQNCLARLAADALLVGSSLSDVPRSTDGTQARWFRYPFTFVGNPTLPPLAPGWVSGLAQGGALHALHAVYERLGDATYEQAAEQAFSSFLVSFQDGGFVTTEHGRTWFQEYPTSPPTYVLNGHNEATIALGAWYKATGDRRALDLFHAGVAATKKALPEQQVPVPQGTASVYDEQRGGAQPGPLRVVSTSSLVVRSAALTDATGRQVSTLKLPVVSATPVSRPNLMLNPSFTSWSGGLPLSWKYAGPALSEISHPAADRLRITTSGKGYYAVYQDVAAAKIAPGRWYRLTFTARSLLQPGVPGISGRVRVKAHCAGGWTTLTSDSGLRGANWAGYTLLFKIPPTSCSLRVLIESADPSVARTVFDLTHFQLTVPDYAVGLVPSYPLERFEGAPLKVTAVYTGAGRIQVWRRGCWLNVVTLPYRATAGTGSGRIPEIDDGANLHLGYHELHVAELAQLYRMTGDQVLLDYARRWIPLAPTKNGLLDGITAAPIDGAAPSPPPTASP